MSTYAGPSRAALAHERQELKLQELFNRHLNDSDEANTLREEMELTWYQMSPPEQELMNELSGDLYMLSGEEVLEEGTASYDDVDKAWSSKNYEIVLDLLRKHRDERLTEDRIAYLRALAWGQLGFREARLAFMAHAADADPRNGTYAYLALFDAIELDHMDDALARARAGGAPETTVRPLIVAVHAVLRHVHGDGARLSERAVTLLTRAGEEGSRRSRTEQLLSLLVGAFVEVGLCHELDGDTNLALLAYNDALMLDPESDVALTLRGLLYMAKHDVPAAERDFERAVTTRTPLVWPYLYLAPMYLRREEYAACRQICSAALEHAEDQDDDQRASFHEWLTIANRERGSEVVRDTSIEASRQRFREALTRHPPMLAAA